MDRYARGRRGVEAAEPPAGATDATGGLDATGRRGEGPISSPRRPVAQIAPSHRSPRQSETPRVSIVIPTWNGARLLEHCLASLRAQRFRDYEILVVDNGSTDGSRAVVERLAPEAQWIPLSRNRGFSVAANAGIRAARGEYVALLNNDTEADPGWLEALVAALDRRPEVGLTASRMRNLKYRDRIDGAGDALAWCGVAWKIGAGEPDDGRFDEEREVFGACAGAALYRRAMLDDIGLFEESFFAYYEDVDLSFRAQLAGYRCLYVPEAIVYHVGSATSGCHSDFVIRLSLRNHLLNVVRNYPAPYLRSKLPDLVLMQCALVRWNWRTRPSVLLWCYASFLLNLPRALAARRRIQARRRVPPEAIDRLMGRHVDSEVGMREAGRQLLWTILPLWLPPGPRNAILGALKRLSGRRGGFREYGAGEVAARDA